MEGRGNFSFPTSVEKSWFSASKVGASTATAVGTALCHFFGNDGFSVGEFDQEEDGFLGGYGDSSVLCTWIEFEVCGLGVAGGSVG